MIQNVIRAVEDNSDEEKSGHGQTNSPTKPQSTKPTNNPQKDPQQWPQLPWTKPNQSKQPQKGPGGNKHIFLLSVGLAFFAIVIYQLSSSEISKNEVLYSDLRRLVEQGQVENIFEERSGRLNVQIAGEPRESIYIAQKPADDSSWHSLIDEYGVSYRVEQEPGALASILLGLIPWILVIGLIWFLMIRQTQGAGNRVFSFGKSKAKLTKPENVKTTFADVAGIEEAKREVSEIVEFLSEPARFQKLGARIPRGVLLTGPPGTGKTLLAKAVAGEANCPFFSMSGSDFVEMFVGVGASRVRDLFENGRRHSPCIVFIDELDAVGRSRGAGHGGGHDEREQTLNQMLVEMDGLDTHETVIIIAATNRPDILDPALLRPGRFDRQVVVPNPDREGRERILEIHSKKVKLGSAIDLSTIARGTPGFSGADLENLVNEAAIFAGRRKGKSIEASDFEQAKDKVMMGPERSSMIIPEEERINTAYHESGHAILGFLLPNADPVHKLTIMPRGFALGTTHFLPKDDHRSVRKDYLKDQIVILLGGRAAEERHRGDGNVTTGASNDIERATDIARAMVCTYGMSELGPLRYGDTEKPVFFGKGAGLSKTYSEDTAQKIDLEIRRIVSDAEAKAAQLIDEHWKQLEKLALRLVKDETLTAKEINETLEIKPHWMD